MFYALTAFPKLSAFERVVHALILTAIIQLIVFPIQYLLLLIGQSWAIAEWNGYGCSLFVALILGHVLAWGANSNRYHEFLNRFGITSRTSRPSQWFSAFHGRKRFVTLHLKNGRRLMGWPNEWPDTSEGGHFLIEEPEWVLDDNSRAPVLTDAFILVAASDVEMVEFLKTLGEIEEFKEEIKETEVRLIEENERNDDERSEEAGDP